MLSWADEMTAAPMDRGRGTDVVNGDADLLELYCGNGNFAIAIAHNFRRCFATELAPELVSLAQENAELNGVTNLAVGVASAKDVAEALRSGFGLASFPQLK